MNILACCVELSHLREVILHILWDDVLDLVAFSFRLFHNVGQLLLHIAQRRHGNVDNDDLRLAFSKLCKVYTLERTEKVLCTRPSQNMMLT